MPERGVALSAMATHLPAEHCVVSESSQGLWPVGRMPARVRRKAG